MAGKIGITFKESKEYPIHRWYPYVEGFSAGWVGQVIDIHCEHGMSIYDPFGGSGTTNLEASKKGFESYFSETNPFMRFTLNTKINIVRDIVNDKEKHLSDMKNVQKIIRSNNFQVRSALDFDNQRYHKLVEKGYFQMDDLDILASIFNMSNGSEYSDQVKTLIKFATACIAVDTSNMTRRADLRRRRSDEYLTRVVDVREQFLQKWNEFILDVQVTEGEMQKAVCVSNDVRIKSPEYANKFDFVITSPPYINGTNYIRNSTLELYLLGFVDGVEDLKCLKNSTVCGGISDAAANRVSELITFSFVEEIAVCLDKNAKDKRIPFMIRCYFSDMYKALENVYNMMKKGAKFIIDIGDSKFYGVYVPTDRILVTMAEMIGFTSISIEKIARRFSRDKTELGQVLIVFQK